MSEAAVKEIKKKLDKAILDEDLSRAADILDHLSTVTMSITLLRSSKIGLTMSKLRKHNDVEIANKARKLLETWKELVRKASPMKEIPKNGNCKIQDKKEEEFHHDVQEKVPEVPLHNRSHSEKSIPVKETSSTSTFSKETASPKPFLTSSVNSHSPYPLVVNGLNREEAVQKSEKAFFQSPNSAEYDPRVVRDIALQIEEELYKMFHKIESVDDKKSYVAKLRSLFWNLKDEKNTSLRESLISGQITANQLVNMTKSELLCKEKQQERKAKEEYFSKAAQRGGFSDMPTTDMFRCGKCGQRKTVYTQLQTRSADEPMTTYITCTVCSHRWKTC